MGKQDRYIVGLDIGSTKTCALIAEMDGDQLKFVALGAAESKGLRKGLIVNLDATVSSIRRAVEEAEGVAGVPVESAWIGVAGGHVRGVNSRGGVALGARARDIERDDIRRAVDAARNITLPDDREILHVLPHGFHRPDRDAFWKSTLDALVHAKLLKNDSPKWCVPGDVEYQWRDKCGTRITLEELDPE